MRNMFSAAVIVAILTCNAVADERPNVVILVADDLGWADVSFHGQQIETPNLDRLASEGVELSRFYVCPICSPTRAGLMTGRYPIRYGPNACRPATVEGRWTGPGRGDNYLKSSPRPATNIAASSASGTWATAM